jgi:hypothetical protein
MTIEGPVTMVYKRSRSFFKNTAKSTNKKYSEESGVNPEKMSKRDDGRHSARKIIASIRKETSGTMWDAGALVASRGAGAGGNCTEMCYLAAYHFHQMAPHVPVKVVFVDDPGDHVFLIAGNLPQEYHNRPYNSVAALTRMSAGMDSYVVDVWAGLCCRTGQYAAAFSAKMGCWTRQGKLIRFEKFWVEPAEPGYLDAFLNSTFNVLAPA